MSTIVATKDSQAKMAVKTPQGIVNLPSEQAQTTFIPTAEIVRQFSANTVGTWSTYSEWVLDVNQLPNIVDRFTLVMALNPATMTGGTYISMVNDSSFFNRLIEVSIGSQVIASLYPENIYLQEVMHRSNEQKTLLLRARGNDTLANRKVAAAAGQTLYIDLPIPFVQKHGWFAGSAAGQLRIKLYHADLSSVVDTDGTAPVLTFKSLTMNIAGRQYLDQGNVGALVQMQRKLGQVDERFLDVVQMQNTLQAGSTTYTVLLNNLVGMCSHFLFVVRASSSVGTALGNSQDAFLPIVSYDFKDSAGNLVMQSTNSAYALSAYVAKYISGDMTDNNSGIGSVQKYVYPIFFGSQPEQSLKKGTYFGSYKMGGLDKLDLVFATALPSNYVVDCIAYMWSNLAADSQGAVKKTLLV